MNKRTTFYAFCLMALSVSPAARAQERVAVRTGTHDGYIRMVFDWAQAVPYTLQETSPGDLTLAFGRAAKLDTSSVDAGKGKTVTSIAQSSAPGAALKVDLGLAPGTTYRHFAMGSRVIVDLMNGPAQAVSPAAPRSQAAPQKSAETSRPAPVAEKKAEEKKSAETKAAENKTAEEKKTAAADAKAAASDKVAASVEPAADGAEEKPQALTPPAAPVTPAPAAAVPAIPAAAPVVSSPAATVAADAEIKAATYTVNFSTTTETGLAVFVRNNNLWIVMDRVDVPVAPEITGQTPGIFPPFTRYELNGGVAFRTVLPTPAILRVYGDGGGLIWHIILTPEDRAESFAPVERTFLTDQPVRGGTALWPLHGVTKILEVGDPTVGDELIVGTVDRASQFAGPEHDFVDFTQLQSPIGIAMAPKVDDLKIEASLKGFSVTRPGGLALSRLKDVKRRLIREDVTEAAPVQAGSAKDTRRIYDFERWTMGGLQALRQNQRILMSAIPNKDKNGRVQDLLTLAKMSIANDRGPEALGYLDYAAEEVPAVMDGAEYKALRGAAYALSNKFELAMADLNWPALKDYVELDFWRAYVYAGLEDWQQASKVMPSDYSILRSYPQGLREKMAPRLAEIALRAGEVPETEGILTVLPSNRSTLHPWTLAAIDYLKGEAHRQSKEYGPALQIWQPLVSGADHLYRAKAGLALTMLQLQMGTIKKEEAIDRLEGLRYTWRGDELEAQVNFMLGKLYIDDRRFLKGFGILREAVTMSPDSNAGHEINAYMHSKFFQLIMEDKDLTPLEAVSIFEEFSDLTPVGDDGNLLIQRLAERLVDADLLDRAANTLQHQVDYMLTGADKGRVAIRLAAIYLLNSSPEKAIAALDVAEGIFKPMNNEIAYNSVHRAQLLRARALSQMGKSQDALNLLATFDPDPDVNRLRADIAWQARRWDDAADALQDLIIDDKTLDPAKPLSDKQADLILNRAVSLNLANNRVELANMRQRYTDAMSKTPRAKLFDVITRPRQSMLLSDRETMQAIVSEVDIFKDFLDSYRKSDMSN